MCGGREGRFEPIERGVDVPTQERSGETNRKAAKRRETERMFRVFIVVRSGFGEKKGRNVMDRTSWTRRRAHRPRVRMIITITSTRFCPN